jgi:hypothetical protein
VAEVPPDLVKRVHAEVAANGKAFFELQVTCVNDAGEQAAVATFQYRVKAPKPG